MNDYTLIDDLEAHLRSVSAYGKEAEHQPELIEEAIYRLRKLERALGKIAQINDKEKMSPFDMWVVLGGCIDIARKGLDETEKRDATVIPLHPDRY